MGVVGAAVSVVSGIAGISSQNKAAAAQQQALASQQQQQALTAQLNYLGLKNQQYADQINDVITDATRELQYQQTQNQLDAQQTLNNIAVANAKFDANIAKASANIQQKLSDTNALGEKVNQDYAARQQELATNNQANQEQDQATQALLKFLGEGGQQQSAIANLLDQAAARGGTNEALSLLLGSDNLDAIRASAEIQRGGEVQAARAKNSANVANSSVALNATDFINKAGINQFNNTLTNFGAYKDIQDAEFSQNIADQGFSTARTANDANYAIGFLSDKASRYARDYLSQANESTVLQGANLQNQALAAQANAIQRPGFFDYLGVGLQGYNTYQSMQPRQVPQVKYATK